MEDHEYTGQTAGKQATSPTAMRRRGVVAAAAALMAGLVARDLKDAQPAAAQAAVILDATNNGVGTTSIVSSGVQALVVRSNFTGAVGIGPASAIQGYAQNGIDYGVQGLVNNGVGVQGGVFGTIGTPTVASLSVQGVNFSQGTGHTAVQGLINPQPGGTYDQSQTFGIEGRNDGNGFGRIGVMGTIGPTPANSTLTTAVNALNLNTGPQSYGVFAVSDSANGIALQAQSANGVGILGQSNGTAKYGVIGTTNGSGSYALWGYATGPSSVGVLGQGVASTGSIAGFFSGNVQVAGQFIVYGGPKNGAVPHPDGQYRLLYCMESPEAWFEDFGEASLVNGRAEVKLDPDFAAVVDSSKMHVFVMEHGANNALHIATKNASGFAVEADARALAARGQEQGETNGTFSYRIVAKRKDNPGERLAKFTPFKVRDEKPPAAVDFPYDSKRAAAHAEFARQSLASHKS